MGYLLGSWLGLPCAKILAVDGPGVRDDIGDNGGDKLFSLIANCLTVLQGATTGLKHVMMDVISVVSLCKFLKAADAFCRTIYYIIDLLFLVIESIQCRHDEIIIFHPHSQLFSKCIEMCSTKLCGPFGCVIQ